MRREQVNQLRALGGPQGVGATGVAESSVLVEAAEQQSLRVAEVRVDAANDGLCGVVGPVLLPAAFVGLVAAVEPFDDDALCTPGQ
ncbi:hypothetical protein [Micromonospora sp. CPCC 205556]|uniref:hypothetical protein n=1 Tax=Micromonospora sp. CPCC 205556 TaxID=3122398 RepID=UPI002FF43A27